MADDCVFCQIVQGQAPASFVYQDDAIIAFMDIQPITQGHVLVVPRVHTQFMQDLDDQVALRAFRVARKLAAVVGPTLGAGGVNLVVMDGEVAFQDVPHFHIHVIPRYKGDGFGLTFPPSYTKPPSRAQLEAIAAALHSAAFFFLCFFVHLDLHDRFVHGAGLSGGTYGSRAGADRRPPSAGRFEPSHGDAASGSDAGGNRDQDGVVVRLNLTPVLHSGPRPEEDLELLTGVHDHRPVVLGEDDIESCPRRGRRLSGRDRGDHPGQPGRVSAGGQHHQAKGDYRHVSDVHI
jgi:histidine triad (HIT) family protein